MDNKNFVDMVNSTFEKSGKQYSRLTEEEYNRLLEITLGMIGESGEVIDELKKHLFKGSTHMEAKAQLIHELGDLLYYMVALMQYFNMDIDLITTENYYKMVGRGLID